MANHRAESGKLLFLRMISIVEIIRPNIRIPDQNALFFWNIQSSGELDFICLMHREEKGDQVPGDNVRHQGSDRQR